MKILYTACLALLLASCNSAPSFTNAEKYQAHYLIEAMSLDNQATELSNSGTANTYRSQEVIDRMYALKSAALVKAEQIPASVLVKMHPDLPAQLSLYKQGLTLQIDNLKNRNITSEIKGH